MTPQDDVEIDVLCNDEWVAGCSGSGPTAWREAMHYAEQYAQDGVVTFREVIRRPLTLDRIAELLAGATPTRSE